MKAKTKQTIVEVGSFAITICASAMLGWAAGFGTTAIINAVAKDGVSKGAAKFFGTVICLGSVGIAWTAIDPIYTQVRGRMEDVMDIFPTDAKEVKSDD